jgi:hypothetical protein
MKVSELSRNERFGAGASILADQPAQSSHQDFSVIETQREDRRGTHSRRKAILPRRCPPVGEIAGGTETVVNSQLSRMGFYKRFLLQSQTLSLFLPLPLRQTAVRLQQSVKIATLTA